MSKSKLLGAAEVCRLLGIQRMTLKRLREAKRFPKPKAELAAGPVWTLGQIERYQERNR